MRQKRYCINIDQCIAVPTIGPIIWSVFLLVVYLFAFLINISGNLNVFFETIVNSWMLWVFLSGPISIILSILISLIFIFLPVSYVKIGKSSLVIHRAFKKERTIEYKELLFIRINLLRQKKWPLTHFVLLEGGELNTIEIRTSNKLIPSFWFSSTKRTYVAICKQLKTCLSEKELSIEEGFVADKMWISQNGSPNDLKW